MHLPRLALALSLPLALAAPLPDTPHSLGCPWTTLLCTSACAQLPAAPCAGTCGGASGATCLCLFCPADGPALGKPTRTLVYAPPALTVTRTLLGEATGVPVRDDVVLPRAVDITVTRTVIVTPTPPPTVTATATVTKPGWPWWPPVRTTRSSSTKVSILPTSRSSSTMVSILPTSISTKVSILPTSSEPVVTRTVALF